ncbi:protein prenylyltransferase [Sistotremastrum suecicum HHB10207 ss-3]|uniref:Pre-mRNA-splicing factor SYF1 n=1 Tax=Sistotremastrum suecicum HHB10207 ss-3 TaxID=1314776 RepID=A0A166GTB0_9AGAM|nr:protein prenylyltransferase [Sistotremastrum suecicum HHB10207 ss-3]
MTSTHRLPFSFPLTNPIPNPLTHPDLLALNDLHREEDLLRNPFSFISWWNAINQTREAASAAQKTAVPDVPADTATLLGPLSTPVARSSLQRLTYLYESALVNFPSSFKLWKAYLQMRSSYVLGKIIITKRAGGKKKLPSMKEALEDEKEYREKWDGGLDGTVGWEEWKSLVSVFERALMWLPKMPRIWLMYFSVLSHPSCPPVLARTHARRTFDRALRTLPPSLHSRIWVRYLLHAEEQGGPALVSIYRRYSAVDPSIVEYYTSLLLNDTEPRPLEAAKLLLGLARKAAKGEYTSAEGKSPYQLLSDWIDVVEKFPEQVGLSLEELENEPEISTNVDAENGDKAAYDEDEDPRSSKKQNIERIVRKDGLEVYKDQAGRLWSGLSTYWVKRGEFDKAKATFETGIASVLTIRDFTQIFDAYAEFSESLISALMDALADEDDEDEKGETEKEVDARMKEFEELMDRRPFLVNDVILRRNPHDVQEWEKRVALWGDDDQKVAETYTKALETVNPRRATANFHRLYVNFAKFYEEGGVTGEAEKDLDSARKILEKATQVNFKAVDELAEVWCEWSEMELRHENYEEAIRVMQRAAVIPKNSRISYHDQSLPVQARLFKSLKLWSFYVDLEESIGTVETTKAIYDKILELRIANAQIIVNYAAFLEANRYYEESFKVYERGVELFTYPVSFEIWNIYLSKFVKRYGGSKIERARDLFEQALEKCPEKFCKPLFLMYAQLEEEFGLSKRAMNIYERATQVVKDEDKFQMFTIYIAKVAANSGLPATRPIYERAIEVLPNRQTAQMCLRFAQLERKLGEIDRARAIYAHASQFCDPRVEPKFWSEWNAFEIETGSEDTFREYLRIKRSVQASFNTEASYIAAQTVAARTGTGVPSPGPEVETDAMASVEKQTKGGFVAAQHETGLKPQGVNGDGSEGAAAGNEDEIQISDEE